MKKLILTTSILLLAAACNNNQQAQVQPVQNQPTSTSQAVQAQPQATSTDASMASWKTYTNDQYGFEVKYPSDWLTQSGDPLSPNVNHNFVLGLSHPTDQDFFMEFDLYPQSLEGLLKDPHYWLNGGSPGNAPSMEAVDIGGQVFEKVEWNPQTEVLYIQNPSKTITVSIFGPSDEEVTNDNDFMNVLSTFKFTK